jgi:serine/threonine protein kinase
MDRVGCYVLSKFLGAGSAADVWECHKQGSREILACKIIGLRLMGHQDNFRHFVNEIHIHSRIRHPCITELKDVIVDASNIYVFMELCRGGDLNDLVQASQGLDEDVAKRYFHHVIGAIAYLHKLGIAHRDIKLENILISAEGQAKLADFGLCRLLPRDRQMQTVCGTLVYAAPEIVKAEPYGLPVDIWSAGVLLYAMVACHFPWAADDELSAEQLVQETARQIVEGPINFPDTFSFELVELLQYMMALDPSDRPTADQILQHSWLNPADDVTIRCNMDPDQTVVGLVDSAIRVIEKTRMGTLIC